MTSTRRSRSVIESLCCMKAKCARPRRLRKYCRAQILWCGVSYVAAASTPRWREERMADKRKRNVAALGALTVLAVAVFFWGFYYLLGNPVFKGGMDVVVTLEHGAGIKRGDRVLL